MADPGLTGGEIAGVVIGSMAMVVLIAGLVFIALRPPESIRVYIYPASDGGAPPPPSATRGMAVTERKLSKSSNKPEASISFSNPLGDFADVKIRD